jgi:hypothetical protein
MNNGKRIKVQVNIKMKYMMEMGLKNSLGGLYSIESISAVHPFRPWQPSTPHLLERIITLPFIHELPLTNGFTGWDILPKIFFPLSLAMGLNSSPFTSAETRTEESRVTSSWGCLTRIMSYLPF